MPGDGDDVVDHARTMDRTMDIPEDTRSVQSQPSIIASSTGGSVTYPYRMLLKDTSFPRCHLMARPGSKAETFNACLSMLGHGTPFWEPVGDLSRPQKQLNTGISIGDVGFLDDTGFFECHFNIFLPPEDPAQYRCPTEFVPLEPPLESELSKDSMQFPPGTVLVSPGIEASTLSSSPLKIKFTVNAREGGILVLADGASREDLVSTTRVRDYVQKHALDCYLLAKKMTNDSVVYPNGTLYVVTGVDKATTWANCVTYAEETHIRRLWEPSEITYRGAEENSQHSWKSNSISKKELAYKRSRPIEHVGPCALFIRGMRIALNARDWNEHLLRYKTPDVTPFTVIRTSPTLGIQAKMQTLKECRPGYTQSAPAEGGIGIRIIFHPLDVILRLLLEESSSASIAYVEDHIWCSVADKSDASFASIVRLLMQILETHDISEENGLITLVSSQPDPQNQSPPTSSSLWFQLPLYIKQKYFAARKSRENYRKLAKVFPGPKVPAEMLRPDR